PEPIFPPRAGMGKPGDRRITRYLRSLADAWLGRWLEQLSRNEAVIGFGGCACAHPSSRARRPNHGPRPARLLHFPGQALAAGGIRSPWTDEPIFVGGRFLQPGLVPRHAGRSVRQTAVLAAWRPRAPPASVRAARLTLGVRHVVRARALVR